VFPVRYELGFNTQETRYFIVTAVKALNLAYGESVYRMTDTSEKQHGLGLHGTMFRHLPVGLVKHDRMADELKRIWKLLVMALHILGAKQQNRPR
jgi:hypothetical protein